MYVSHPLPFLLLFSCFLVCDLKSSSDFEVKGQTGVQSVSWVTIWDSNIRAVDLSVVCVWLEWVRTDSADTVLVTPSRCNMMFLSLRQIQVCLSEETSVEQRASAPPCSPSPTGTVHTRWVSTGSGTLLVRSAGASSWTEPYSSCVCWPKRKGLKGQTHFGESKL